MEVAFCSRRFLTRERERIPTVAKIVTVMIRTMETKRNNTRCLILPKKRLATAISSLKFRQPLLSSAQPVETLRKNYKRGANNRSTDHFNLRHIGRLLYVSGSISWHTLRVSTKSPLICITLGVLYNQTPFSKWR